MNIQREINRFKMIKKLLQIIFELFVLNTLKYKRGKTINYYAWSA